MSWSQELQNMLNQQTSLFLEEKGESFKKLEGEVERINFLLDLAYKREKELKEENEKLTARIAELEANQTLNNV